MPKLVRLYIRSAVIGVLLSAAFVALLLGTNVANLGHLVLSSDMGLVALAMMLVFNAVVFSGVQFGLAVMRLAEPEDQGGGPRLPEPVAEPALVPVAAPAAARQPG